MKYLILGLVLGLLSGCFDTKVEHDNTVCYKAIVQKCGVHLWNCANGNEYYCVINAKELPHD